MVSSRRELDPELTILGGRDLVALVGRLVRERSWEALTTLFEAIGVREGIAHVTPADLDAATRLLADALTELAAGKRPSAVVADELRALRMAAAESLLSRSRRPPVGELERRILDRAGTLLADGGDHRRAALAYEDLGDDVRAAGAWGALGDLERMEAALAREERREGVRRAAVDAMRRFDALMTGGERREAVAVAALVSGVDEAATAHQLAARVDARLIRGRAVSLRTTGLPPVRVAALPAAFGRDPANEVPMRDPGVSRRHARVRLEDGALVLEDAGSRGGIRLGGARLDGALPLRDTGELALGAASLLRFEADATSALFEGMSGLDRALRALVGVEPIALGRLFPAAEGLALTFSAGGPRLVRPPHLAVRVDGHFIGVGCDLLHGDVIEIVGPPALRIEVE